MPTPPETTGAPRRGRPGHDLDSVLRAAVTLFTRHGYDATSMGTLARELGVGKSAIYHHVSSKGELLRLALDQALVPLEAVGRDDGAVTGPALGRLEHVLRSTIRVLIDRQPYVTLLLRLHGNTDIEREALERRRAVDRQVTELVAAAQADGTVRADVEPRTTTRLMFGTINSLVEWYRPDGPATPQQVEDTAIALIVDGLRARGAAG